MSESMGWPRMQPPHGRRRRFFLIVAVLAGIFFGSRTGIQFNRTTLSRSADRVWAGLMVPYRSGFLAQRDGRCHGRRIYLAAFALLDRQQRQQARCIVGAA